MTLAAPAAWEANRGWFREQGSRNTLKLRSPLDTMPKSSWWWEYGKLLTAPSSRADMFRKSDTRIVSLITSSLTGAVSCQRLFAHLVVRLSRLLDCAWVTGRKVALTRGIARPCSKTQRSSRGTLADELEASDLSSCPPRHGKMPRPLRLKGTA